MIWAFLAVLLLAAGTGLMLFVALETAGLVVYGGWLRYRGGLSRQVRRLRGVAQPQLPTESQPGVKRTARLRPEDAIGLGVLAGVLLARDVLLSILVFAAGAAIWFWIRQLRVQQVDDRLLGDLEIVLLQLRSRLPVTHSIHQSLVSAAQNLTPFSVLKPILVETAKRLEMQQSPREACKSLFDLPNDLARRLAHALSWSADTSEALQVELMGMLLEEIQHQNRLKAEIRRTLGLVRATVRVLQGAVVAGLIVSVTLPMWREYFFADLSHRMLLATLFILSGLASAFFEYRLSTALKADAL